MIFTLVDGMREPSESLAHKYISLVVDTSREIYFIRFAVRALRSCNHCQRQWFDSLIIGREGAHSDFVIKLVR